MRWSDVLASMTVERAHDAPDVDVRGVQYDSRRVSAGDVFVAMRGETTDGNRYIAAALSAGAVAIVTDSAEAFEGLRDVPAALVAHGRRGLAEVSSTVFGRPQDKLKLSAVTGTNGKTTTAFLLEQMLTSVGRKCVLIGTIETHIAGEVRASEHTTPESRDILALFAEGVAAGCTEAVMEMSSHALEQERVWGLPVDVAIFTNLTQDHLDYHGTMGAYAGAKAKMFRGVGAPAPRVAVIEQFGKYSTTMIDAALQAGSDVITYQTGMPLKLVSREQWAADETEHRADGTTFTLRSPMDGARIESRLTGSVNVLNLLAAMASATARGLTMAEVFAAAGRVTAVPGRFESVPNELGFTVIVDYAHTEDALENLLRIAHNLLDGGRVITMFGCGGDRDKTKRPKMGRVAGADSDLVVVTSDNPRSEEPMEIINEVLVGVRAENATFVVEEDRRAAIEIAIRSAKPGDIVLLAGKGHEKVQIFADGAVPFDDVEEAARILRKLKLEVKP